jgi:NAD(P)-dependent dehydrogenase (short-subunit alcohol dehydrogenase family)
MVQRTALVTGGNRGIGLAICRALARQGLKVMLAARDEKEGRGAEAKLKAERLDVTWTPLDVGDPESIEHCRERLEQDHVAIDVLVNNAGTLAKGNPLAVPVPEIDDSWRVNTRGPWLVSQAFVPAMVRRGYGRVVNLSSGWGAFTEGLEPDHAAYAVTKAALNALSYCLGRSVEGDVKVNAMCPGWVRTRMGGGNAELSPEEAADTAVWLATLPADGPTGGFFRDRKSIAW